jgi:succinoglycan biosynthesis protein ExoL
MDRRGARTGETDGVDPYGAARIAPGLDKPVAYFGPDLNDSAVQRRVAQWAHAGFHVIPCAFARNGTDSRNRSEFVNLGSLMPQSLVRRLFPIALGAFRLLRMRGTLGGAQLFIGRNLDNALLALFARRVSRSRAPLVYEIFDVNRVCTDPGVRGFLVRQLERWLLRHVDLLVVSSPHFFSAYFQRVLGYRGDWTLFENKVPRYVHEHPAHRVPAASETVMAARPWRIGWFGYLDDEQSWAILRQVAEVLPKDIIILVRGIQYSDFDMERFLADVGRLDNVFYGGPYRNPEDLADIYNAVDLVWSADCNAPAANSKWLLTNGLYEAGYFGKPVLGMTGNAVGEFLIRHGTGWCLKEPVAESAIEFIRGLSPEAYAAKCREILKQRSRLFIETDEIDQICLTLRVRQSRSIASRPRIGGEPVRRAVEKSGPARTGRLLVLGFFPPPVDGQRVITQSVFEHFETIAQVERYNFGRLHALGSLSKLFSALGACLAMLRARLRGFTALYLAPHSGGGLLFCCVIALLARCLGYSFAVHYHSYWYIGRSARLMATFVAICGPKAIHIVLAPPMERDIRRFYPLIRNVVALSNCGFIAPHAELSRDSGGRALRIGHLSNLSREKGIALVLACMRTLRARGVDVELWLAGPAENKGTDALITAARSEFGDRLKYLGRLAGEEVRRFYQEIDVFLFPSVHRHEAEPLVVIDAIGAGVPVIATDRGCIGYLLDTVGGRVFSVQDYLSGAVEQITAWQREPASLATASRQARGRFIALHRESQRNFERLAAMILGRDVSASHEETVATTPPG